MEQNRQVETPQPVKEDDLSKQTFFAGNFTIGSTKSVRYIYFLLGITGISLSMVNNPYFPCHRILTTSISLLDNTSFRTGRFFLSATSCEADGLHPFLNFPLVLSTKKILSLRVFWLEAERVVL